MIGKGYRRRKVDRRRKAHRQPYMMVLILPE